MNSVNLYHYITQKLSSAYETGEAKALARIVIEDLLGLSMTKVLAGLEPDLGIAEEEKLDITLQRLRDHEPIQYIIRHTEFCGLRFTVTPAVLIPRPETEGIVALAANLFASEAKIRIIDACTGSGCIATSIKHLRPCWSVEAFDISEEALAIARQNAARNNAAVSFFQLDLLSDHLPQGPCDLIISNPPYVMDKEKPTMESNVLDYEPHLALFVNDDDPLLFYRALGTWGQDSLSPDGYLLAEINSALPTETSTLLESLRYRNISIHNDCFGKPRFILCKK